MADRTIDDRVVAYVEGLLDAAGLAALREELASDGAARRRFVLIMTQIGVMRDATRVAEQEMEQPVAHAIVEPVSTARGAMRWRIGPGVWAVAAAVAIAGAAAAVYVMATGGGMSNGVHRAARPVAIVMSADNVRWASSPTEVGEPIEAGRITIDGGELELESMRGATVRVTGPCDLDIVAADRLRLYRGRVSAHIGEGVDGFTVEAPHGIRVVDLGTAFEVAVDAEQSVEVYCSEGRVRIDRAELAGGPANDGAAAIELRAGLGVRYAAGDSATPIAWLVSSDAGDGVYARRADEPGVGGPWSGPARLTVERIGSGGPQGKRAMIAGLAFELPPQVTGDRIERAELELPLLGHHAGRAPAFNVDVYGVAVRDEAALRGDEFYVGDRDARAVRLADDAITPTSRFGTVSVSGEALTHWVRAAFDGDTGAARGRYLVMRLNGDVSATGYDGYVVGFRENESATQTPPRLVLHRRAAAVTEVPVP